MQANASPTIELIAWMRFIGIAIIEVASIALISKGGNTIKNANYRNNFETADFI